MSAAPTCLHCGSPNVHESEYEGPTGVVAPDGCAQIELQRGWKCADCGAIEDEANGEK